MNKIRLFASLFFAIVFILLLLTLFIRPFAPKEIKTGKAEDTLVVVPQYLYGFNLDSFQVDSGIIAKNTSFSDIMKSFSYPQNQINELEDSALNVFPLRKFKAGNRYFVFLSKDSIRKAEYFVYEENPIFYVLMKLQYPLKVSRLQKEVDTIIRTMGGVVMNSLWQDMTAYGAVPSLINALSEVFEWDIDFFRIQKNDKFRIIYEEVKVENKVVSIGRIISAWFEHEGNAYYAIPFEQSGRKDFFDKDGKNLRKMFLKAPLKFSRISSGFSNARFHPILHRYRPHHGIDYAARAGTPVSTIGDGTVVFAGYQGGGGNTVKIRHNATYTSAYLHLSRFAKGIRKGARVKQGETIGYVGSTGLSTGAHLDFRIWKNGVPINPLNLKSPPVESVSAENMPEFIKIRDQYIHELDKIKIEPPAEKEK